MMSTDPFHRKPWRVNWFIPELEHRKYTKMYREDADYQERVNLYFGDVHKHTHLSPCGQVHPYNQSPAQSYVHAREIAETDFLAICDHAERMTEEQWAESMQAAQQHNENGRFVAWPAVEWAAPLHGHRNIYYRGYDVPLISARTYSTLDRLWAVLHELDTPALTIPHHAARELVADLSRTDAVLEPAYEIFSGWGNEEYYGAPLQDTDRCFTRNFAIDTLMRGFRMGFVGGGDGHPAPPGESGITGIYAPELTLESLFDALMQRRTIATTGAKIQVDVHVNGYPIGSVIRFNQHQVDELFPLTIGVAVQGTANLEKVEIVENGITVHTKTKPRARLDQMAYTWYREARPSNGPHVGRPPGNVSRFIYVRVTQRDGHMAWTSPIWLDYVIQE